MNHRKSLIQSLLVICWPSEVLQIHLVNSRLSSGELLIWKIKKSIAILHLWPFCPVFQRCSVVTQLHLLMATFLAWTERLSPTPSCIRAWRDSCSLARSRANVWPTEHGLAPLQTARVSSAYADIRKRRWTLCLLAFRKRSESPLISVEKRDLCLGLTSEMQSAKDRDERK